MYIEWTTKVKNMLPEEYLEKLEKEKFLFMLEHKRENIKSMAWMGTIRTKGRGKANYDIISLTTRLHDQHTAGNGVDLLTIELSERKDREIVIRLSDGGYRTSISLNFNEKELKEICAAVKEGKKVLAMIHEETKV